VKVNGIKTFLLECQVLEDVSRGSSWTEKVMFHGRKIWRNVLPDESEWPTAALAEDAEGCEKLA
jgi:hypothetical protein